MKRTNKINTCEHITSTRIRTLLIWLHLPLCPSPGPYVCLPPRGATILNFVFIISFWFLKQQLYYSYVYTCICPQTLLIIYFCLFLSPMTMVSYCMQIFFLLQTICYDYFYKHFLVPMDYRACDCLSSEDNSKWFSK